MVPQPRDDPQRIDTRFVKDALPPITWSTNLAEWVNNAVQLTHHSKGPLGINDYILINLLTKEMQNARAKPRGIQGAIAYLQNARRSPTATWSKILLGLMQQFPSTPQDKQKEVDNFDKHYRWGDKSPSVVLIPVLQKLDIPMEERISQSYIGELLYHRFAKKMPQHLNSNWRDYE